MYMYFTIIVHIHSFNNQDPILNKGASHLLNFTPSTRLSLGCDNIVTTLSPVCHNLIDNMYAYTDTCTLAYANTTTHVTVRQHVSQPNPSRWRVQAPEVCRGAQTVVESSWQAVRCWRDNTLSWLLPALASRFGRVKNIT